MKTSSGAPAQKDREGAGVGFPGSRGKLDLQELVDEASSLLIRGDADRIGGHTTWIRSRAAASYLCTESTFWPVADAGAATAYGLLSRRVPLSSDAVMPSFSAGVVLPHVIDQIGQGVVRPTPAGARNESSNSGGATARMRDEVPGGAMAGGVDGAG
jgi:hypothetical protein